MYSGFWKRFLAFWIDKFVMSGLIYLICFIIRIPSNEALIYSGINPYKMYGSTTNTSALFVWIFIIIIPWIYYAIFESSYLQATPGKIVLGMIVTDVNEKRISFGVATLRYFSKILSSFIIGIGFFMIAFTQKKQGLHDMIASTIVINK